MLLLRGMCVKGNPVGEVLHSEDHINLETVGSPHLKNVMRRHSANASKRKSQGQLSESLCKPKKPKKLTNKEVSKVLVANKIRTETEPMVVAKEQNNNGEGDIYSFIMNKSQEALSDLIHATWKMENAAKVQERACTSQMGVVQQHLNEPCVETCAGSWFSCAKEVLKSNGINEFTYDDSIR